jgi:sugar phosphate isomerase/epimerase
VRGISTGAYEEERDTWSAAVDRAQREGWQCLELCAILPPLLSTLAPYLTQPGHNLDSFERVSIHAPVGIDSADVIVQAIIRLPHDGDVILHPDLYSTADTVFALGDRAVFENMDVAKSFGRTVEDLTTVFERFPDAGLCLDVAHVWTNDRSLTLGHELLDAFGDRLRQVHVSGIEPDGTHRKTTEDDLSLYAPLLERCADVPQVLETVLETS